MTLRVTRVVRHALPTPPTPHHQCCAPRFDLEGHIRRLAGSSGLPSLSRKSKSGVWPATDVAVIST
jgi:hypothetical protein